MGISPAVTVHVSGDRGAETEDLSLLHAPEPEIPQTERYSDIAERRSSLRVIPSHPLAFRDLSARSSPVEKVSSFCPIDLYSGSADRAATAVRALLANPQNNLRLFLSSGRLPSCESERHQTVWQIDPRNPEECTSFEKRFLPPHTASHGHEPADEESSSQQESKQKLHETDWFVELLTDVLTQASLQDFFHRLSSLQWYLDDSDIEAIFPLYQWACRYLARATGSPEVSEGVRQHLEDLIWKPGFEEWSASIFRDPGVIPSLDEGHFRARWAEVKTILERCRHESEDDDAAQLFEEILWLIRRFLVSVTIKDCSIMISIALIRFVATSIIITCLSL